MAWQVLKQYGRSFGTGFIVGLPIYITVTDLGFCVARVDGISMQPSLNPSAKESDIVLLDRWTARDVFNVKRGDVVSLISPSDPDVKLIKRVIGLEGDVIKTIGYQKRYVSIPKGHCWVEGDHRGKSFDSNKFGPISLGLINGIATRIVWPPKRWTKIEANVAKDRMPLRRSFNQCTFSDMLKNPEEPATSNNDSSSKTSRDESDVVAMKRKLLSDDRFLGSGTANLSEEKKSPVYGNFDDAKPGNISEYNRARTEGTAEESTAFGDGKRVIDAGSRDQRKENVHGDGQSMNEGSQRLAEDSRNLNRGSERLKEDMQSMNQDMLIMNEDRQSLNENRQILNEHRQNEEERKNVIANECKQMKIRSGGKEN